MPASASRKKSAPRLDNEILAFLHVHSLETGKSYYKKADAALDQLLKQAKVGDVIILSDSKSMPTTFTGRRFRIADKFAKRNSIGVGLSARRFELEEVTSP